MTTTLEAPAAPQAPEVAALSDATRKELVALREGGMTLAELKTRFPQLTGDQIREVLPPGNARERRAKEGKTKVNETQQGIGGRSAKAKSEAKPKAQAEPEPASRWVTGQDAEALAEQVLAARQVVGRNRLAELLETTGSAVWRAEQGRIHEDEVDGLKAELDVVEKRIAAGEFVKAAAEPKAKQASKAELLHRVEVVTELVRSARSDKSITKATLIDSALAVLNPTNAPKA
jgi:hypothetical protein